MARLARGPQALAAPKPADPGRSTAGENDKGALRQTERLQCEPLPRAPTPSLAPDSPCLTLLTRPFGACSAASTSRLRLSAYSPPGRVRAPGFALDRGRNTGQAGWWGGGGFRAKLTLEPRSSSKSCPRGQPVWSRGLEPSRGAITGHRSHCQGYAMPRRRSASLTVLGVALRGRVITQRPRPANPQNNSFRCGSGSLPR